MKAEIWITDGHNYALGVKDGAKFIAVDYKGRNYGGAFPCDNEDDVKRCIEWAKDSIIREGDEPVVVDKRQKVGLLRWL